MQKWPELSRRWRRMNLVQRAFTGFIAVAAVLQTGIGVAATLSSTNPVHTGTIYAMSVAGTVLLLTHFSWFVTRD
jgi:hypothetical protein